MQLVEVITLERILVGINCRKSAYLNRRIDVTTRIYNCSIEAALDVIGGKWKPMILWWLSQGTLRFAELRRMIPGITEKVLTQHLRELEEQGIVNRRVYRAVPPKVEYSLTTYGQTLKKALKELCDWGELHIKKTGAKIHPDFIGVSVKNN